MQIRHIPTERPITDWLPTTKKEVESRGWEQLDIITSVNEIFASFNSLS